MRTLRYPRPKDFLPDSLGSFWNCFFINLTSIEVAYVFQEAPENF
jgi:hypothetical protein